MVEAMTTPVNTNMLELEMRVAAYVAYSSSVPQLTEAFNRFGLATEHCREAAEKLSQQFRDMDPEERAALNLLHNGEIRLVCNQRKRKLRKRGVRVWWNRYFKSWCWSPTEEKQRGRT